MPGGVGCPPLNPLILSLSKDPFLEEGGWGDGQLAETSLHGGLDGSGLPRTGHHDADGAQRPGSWAGPTGGQHWETLSRRAIGPSVRCSHIVDC